MYYSYYSNWFCPMPIFRNAIEVILHEEAIIGNSLFLFSYMTSILPNFHRKWRRNLWTRNPCQSYRNKSRSSQNKTNLNRGDYGRKSLTAWRSSLHRQHIHLLLECFGSINNSLEKSGSEISGGIDGETGICSEGESDAEDDEPHQNWDQS